MGRPILLKTRVARNVIFENDELKEFEEIVGKDNVSKEIRGLIHNFLIQEKKGYALTDPLNLSKHKPIVNELLTTNNNNISLDIYLLSNKDIVKNLEKITDVRTLADLENKGKLLNVISRKRKFDRISIENAKKEMMIR